MSDAVTTVMIVAVTIIAIMGERWRGERAEKDEAEKSMLQRFEHNTPNVLDRTSPSGPRPESEGLAGDRYSLRAKPLRFGGAGDAGTPAVGTNGAIACFDSQRIAGARSLASKDFSMRESFKALRPGWEGVAVATVAARLPPVTASPPPHWIGRLFNRREPTLFQRCLALHIANASEIGALR